METKYPDLLSGVNSDISYSFPYHVLSSFSQYASQWKLAASEIQQNVSSATDFRTSSGSQIKLLNFFPWKLFC
jgi:hypothetical protein